MNEINLNPLSRSAEIDKSSSTVAKLKNVSPRKLDAEFDSVQLSKLPDLSSAEGVLEDEFANLRARLKDEVDSPGYPPLETIDRLAHMLAVNLNQTE